MQYNPGALVDGNNIIIGGIKEESVGSHDPTQILIDLIIH
jgi:hypothetical protein